MKALLIDHDDSFTYNLRDWLNPAFSVEVRNHRDLEVGNVKGFLTNLPTDTLIVLSPGPKAPSDYNHIQNFIRQLSPHQKVFGVCLGMQMMVECEGGFITPYTPPLHGKKSKLKILQPQFLSFSGLTVARYHSLQCEIKSSIFEILAVSDDDQKPLWVRHQKKNWAGFQFHPESFLTEMPEAFLGYLAGWCKS
jgi:anthranilate synthase/aminodeoxychorismate synthase-like glutamine amidotransferase